MKLQRRFTLTGASVGMLVLILDGKTALSGAREGIELCLMTLIPSLFPFFVVSILMTGALTGQRIPFLRPLGQLLHIPQGSEFLLAIGFLGGYPVGAQNISLACQRGQLSRADGKRMLGFCSNAGPAFLFGIMAPMFTQAHIPWLLWGIHILSALLVGMVLPGDTNSSQVNQNSRPVRFQEALEKSVRTMALVCGWVVIFRMILTFLQRWVLWALPTEVTVIISGILELSNGCVQLETIPSEGLRFLIAGALLSLGGVCVTMQTASVCDGLSLRSYFPGKLLQGCFSLLLCALCQGLFPAAARWDAPPLLLLSTGLCTIFLVIFLRKSEKSCSIPASVGV